MRNCLVHILSSLFLFAISACSNPFGGKSLIDINSVSLGWSNTNFDFGNQQIGSSSLQTFYIKNTGNSDAVNCGPVTLSDSINFSIVSQTCTHTLLQGEQCEVVVESHPQSAGAKNLVLDRSCQVRSSIVSLTNNVKVNAIQPTANWAPLAHSFGTVQVSQSSFTKKFTLTNSGTSAITNCGLVSLSNVTDFYIQNETCGFNDLAVNGSCEVVVAARPGSTGLKSTTLSRTCQSNYTFSTTLNQITASGYESFLALYPYSIDFNNQYENTSVATYAYMQNETNANLVSCTAATLDDNTNFSIMYDDCGTRGLSSWDGCSIGVQTSSASAIGEHLAVLSRSCTFADSSVKSISIPIRVNTIAATPLLYVFYDYNYGSTYVGQSGAQQTFYFYNGGYKEATGCASPVLSNTTDFTVVTNNCSSTLNYSSMCDVTVSANPASTGSKSASLSMTCADGGTVAASLIQNAKPSAPDLIINPETYNYSNVGVGGAGSDYTFTLNNLGPVAATGCSAPALSNSTDFSIITDTCSTNDVAATGYCSITVKALPTTTGTKTSSLTRTCASGGTVTANLTAEGFIAAPNLYWHLTSYDFGDVNIGAVSSASYIYLYNNGSATATGCSAPVLSNTTDFSILYQSCGTNNLSVGNYCYVQVRANPQSGGNRTTTLSRTCTVGGTASTQTNGFTVKGKLTADWKMEYAGISSFGVLSMGKTSNTIKYFFRNPNDDSLTGCTVPTLSNTSDYEITTNSCAAGSMSAGSACAVEVRAIGVSLGAKTANLSRSCTETGDKTVALSSVVGPSGKAVSVASGYLATCAVMDNGTVRCWGSARFHTSYYPTEISGITNAVKVSVADYQACVLLSTGQVNCWGWSSYGVLGSSSGGVVPNLTNVIDVVAGKENTCAIVNDGVTELGVIKCWGGYNAPQTPTVIPYTSSGLPITGALQLAAGGYDGREVCALLNTKEIVCGDFYGTGSYTMSKRAGITDAEEISMVSGILFYRKTAGTVNSGSNLVPGLTNVIKLGSNNTPYSGATCAIVDDGGSNRGVVKCWDRNIYTGNNNTAVQVSGLSHVVSVATGSSNLMCAVLDTGEIKCKTDYNTYGSIGDLTTESKALNKFDLGGAVQNASTSSMSCALMQTGQVKCWGSGGEGGLGDGVTSSSTSPVIVSGITNAIEVKTGQQFGCAILATGNVKCWGWNWFGKLGNGNSTSSKSPVDVVNLSNVKTMTMGDQMACAIIDDGASNIGTVKCWGSNSGGGVLGGSNSNLSTPVDMGISGAIKIAADTQTTCAVLNTGHIKCWGANPWGQLGIGTTTPNVTYTPMDVLDIDNAVDISAGEWHFCAQLNNGTMKCWGYNSGSQVSSTTDYTRPYLIPELTGIQQIMATSSRSCALLTTGQIKCFGTDVGDLTSSSSAKPQYVMNTQDVKKLVPGYLGNLCYINNSDELICMGKAQNGFKSASGF